MRAAAEQKCREIEIELPLDMEAGECSVGQQQMTEIVRNLLLLDAKVVIMGFARRRRDRKRNRKVLRLCAP